MRGPRRAAGTAREANFNTIQRRSAAGEIATDNDTGQHGHRQSQNASAEMAYNRSIGYIRPKLSERLRRSAGRWLEKLGMPEYAQRFAENGIDVSVLRYLTDQDLEKIGVLLGHRRKMLAAIAELVGAVQAPPQPALTEPKPKDTAERRQVTVMFSDLVGSTALSARMDPEDLREVISAYQKCVAETVQRFGGFVAKYMGDGVLVYFGYPQAHEDDAERAVRAGLELVPAVGGLEILLHCKRVWALPLAWS